MDLSSNWRRLASRGAVVVADNLVAEQRDVYGGRDARLAEGAVDAAIAASDANIAGRVLSEISMEEASPEVVARLARTLAADAPALREGAVLALGSAPPADGTTPMLVERYRQETHPDVRLAILRALARLGQASSRPCARSAESPPSSIRRSSRGSRCSGSVSKSGT